MQLLLPQKQLKAIIIEIALRKMIGKMAVNIVLKLIAVVIMTRKLESYTQLPGRRETVVVVIMMMMMMMMIMILKIVIDCRH